MTKLTHTWNTLSKERSILNNQLNQLNLKSENLIHQVTHTHAQKYFPVTSRLESRANLTANNKSISSREDVNHHVNSVPIDSDLCGDHKNLIYEKKKILKRNHKTSKIYHHYEEPLVLGKNKAPYKEYDKSFEGGSGFWKI